MRSRLLLTTYTDVSTCCVAVFDTCSRSRSALSHSMIVLRNASNLCSKPMGCIYLLNMSESVLPTSSSSLRSAISRNRSRMSGTFVRTASFPPANGTP